MWVLGSPVLAGILWFRFRVSQCVGISGHFAEVLKL